MNYIITNPMDPLVDINSQEDADNYNLKISQMQPPEFILELNNVLAAKHNLSSLAPIHLLDEKKIEVTMCLNDKILIIFGHIFGHENVQNFSGGIEGFLKTVSEADGATAQLNLDTEEHVTKVLQTISKSFR